MTKTQRGVALVQVLLITSMILILVVQLSKDARQQLRTSQINKDKVVALVEMRNVVEKTKFDLLSQRNSEGKAFFGQPQKFDDVVLKIQDVSGLLSLSYGYEQVAQFLGLQPDDQKIVNLVNWQGIGETADTSTTVKSHGFIQYPKGLLAVPLWTYNAELESVLTVVPTRYFNPLGASLPVLEKLYGEDVANEVDTKRNSNNVAAAAQLLSSRALDVVTDTSNIIQLIVEKKIADVTLTRIQTLQINPDSGLVIQVLEY